MKATPPMPIARTAAVRLFRGNAISLIATHICERGWRGNGVRVFAWPCGTIAVVTVGSGADDALLRQCAEQLVATYARHGTRDPGPIYVDVLRELHDLRCV